MADLELIETGNGGDLVLLGNDLSVIEGFQNMPYLAMFGGNVDASTGEFIPEEQNFDYWANSLLFFDTPEVQFNSDLERLLNNVALSTSGRQQIEQTVKTDVAFMLGFSTIEVEVEVAITAVDRLEILIKIQEPTNLQSNEFTYIWDSTQQELTAINN